MMIFSKLSVDTILFCFWGYVRPTREILSYINGLEIAVRDIHEALPGNRYWNEQYQRVQILRHFFQTGKNCGVESWKQRKQDRRKNPQK